MRVVRVMGERAQLQHLARTFAAGVAAAHMITVEEAKWCSAPAGRPNCPTTQNRVPRRLMCYATVLLIGNAGGERLGLYLCGIADGDAAMPICLGVHGHLHGDGDRDDGPGTAARTGWGPSSGAAFLPPA